MTGGTPMTQETPKNPPRSPECHCSCLRKSASPFSVFVTGGNQAPANMLGLRSPHVFLLYLSTIVSLPTEPSKQHTRMHYGLGSFHLQDHLRNLKISGFPLFWHRFFLIKCVTTCALFVLEQLPKTSAGPGTAPDSASSLSPSARSLVGSLLQALELSHPTVQKMMKMMLRVHVVSINRAMERHH